MSRPQQHIAAAMDTRVTVLEGSVDRLERSVESGRSEARQGLSSVQASLDRLVERDARREGAAPAKTNWYAIGGMGAAVFTIVTAIFTLAEWRVGTATAPIIDQLTTQRGAIRDYEDKMLHLRVDLEKERAIREYIEKNIRGK